MRERVCNVVVCGSLNENGPHRLIDSGIIRRCGLLGVGVTLLEEVLRFQKLKQRPSDSFF